MKILGTLTTYGEQLYAESVTNGTKVEITRIAAGSGETPLTNEYITGHEMYSFQRGGRWRDNLLRSAQYGVRL